MKTQKHYLATTMILLFLYLLIQPVQAVTVRYLSPVPGSKYNNENTNIILGYSNKLTKSFINNLQIKIVGSLSGEHKGSLIPADNNTKIIFKPDVPFKLGEMVSVAGVEGTNDFYFYVRESRVYVPQGTFKEVPFSNSGKKEPFMSDMLFSTDSLPPFTIYNSGNTANGNIFLCNFTGNYNVTSYIMILKNTGEPVYSLPLQYNGYDFKKQNDNLLTYYDENVHYFLGLDRTYNVVSSYYTGNGYNTDFHEIRVLPDGSAWLISYDPELVDMSLIVPGGVTRATVTGLIIQKIDADKNVIFQWRSWDHFAITDCTHENLLLGAIDYVHGNSLEIDNDDNILLSSRHLDEITKINSTTGDIIWRLGGKHNEFTCDNDTMWFSHQHYCRRLSNGNLILFDNGNYHTPSFSRVIEYSIDEVQKTVHIDWQYRHDPDIYAYAMGTAQRLDNGNTLVGWGSATTTLTEVAPNGNVVYELSLPSGELSYRAYRFVWNETVTQENPISQTAAKYWLQQNYPNPFNPTTNIWYNILKGENVSLKVYDITGRVVAELVNGYQNAGQHTVQFPGNGISTSIPSGIYFYRLQTPSFSDVKKMVLVK